MIFITADEDINTKGRVQLKALPFILEFSSLLERLKAWEITLIETTPGETEAAKARLDEVQKKRRETRKEVTAALLVLDLVISISSSYKLILNTFIPHRNML